MRTTTVHVGDYPHITAVADPQGLYALLQDYLAWLRARNYSEATLRGRELFLCALIDWCGQRGVIRPGEVTKPMLERYQRYLFHYRKKNGDPLSFSSQYNRIVAIRTWFRWLARQNHILTNPASDLELPRLEKRLPKAILSEREAETVLAQPDVTDALGLRDRAILETLYSTGIRRMEVVRLHVQSLDAERGTLLVRQGKGRRDRMIPIGERAVLWIEKYLADARPQLVCGRDVPQPAGRVDPRGQPDHDGAWLHRAGEDRQGRQLPPVPSHDGDADAGERRRHPLHPGDARARELEHDRDLHPGEHQEAQGNSYAHASGQGHAAGEGGLG
jgi:site-specific recombinase XerD